MKARRTPSHPEVEFPETQEQQESHQQRYSLPVRRRGGQHQLEEESEEQNEGNSVLSGFSSEFLAETFNTDEDTAKRLRSPRDKRSQIVRVEGGLRIINPEEQEEEEEEQRSEQGNNGLEETICSAKIRENIAHPARADLYNPHAGRISIANSLTLPILRHLRLSAEYVRLYRNGIYAPHWNINANSLLYVIRGEGRVRIVNSQGDAVFDNKVRKGQLVVVPQNFVVAEQAGEEEGLEYVVFKTNDRAAVCHVQQVFRATPAEVLANAFGLRQRQVTELKVSGNRVPLVHPQSQSQSH